MIERGTRAETQQYLLHEVGIKLVPFGFSPKPRGQSFYATAPAGKWAFHIGFIPHPQDFDLTADVAVRIDAIEDLVNQHDSLSKKKDKPKSFTFGGELGNIAGVGQRRWTVSDPSEISLITEKVHGAFLEVGLPLLQRSSTLDAAHRLLVSPHPSELHLVPLLGPRLMRAVASAHLLRLTDELQILIPVYMAKLTQTGDPYREDFNSLVAGIK